MKRAFPDLEIRVDDLVAAGDTVALRLAEPPPELVQALTGAGEGA